jgi:pimeloyl-ACP methyl ester carboxylesterase
MQTPDWLNTREYPFQPHYLNLDGVQMHYVDEGRGEPVVFVHGTPTWSFDYRHLIKNLSADYRCVAPDHIGFGLSDKPREYDYQTARHSENFGRLMAHLNLSNITLVVHDFGGPIALNYAVQHPEKIRRLIILNTWLWSAAGEPEYEKMKKILKSPLLPVLYKYLNFSAKMLIPQSYGDKSRLSKAVHRQYTRPFGNAGERMGTLGFARSLLHDQPWFESIWSRREAISRKPALFLWGMKDKFMPPKYLQKFESAFPDHRTVRFENAGHFPQEECREEVVAAVRDFLDTPHPATTG